MVKKDHEVGGGRGEVSGSVSIKSLKTCHRTFYNVLDCSFFFLIYSFDIEREFSI